ncbi:MAG TPA: halocarboxylic acid dehydrogenase DehI family protein [Terriglobales bacterium]|nr:halocarboxylic acid dehydrogenase DehI family protein [Terriglobales bacterium]
MTSVRHGASSQDHMPLSRKRRLPLVHEADASGRTLDIYQEIKSSLGIPHVNVIFQAYGAYPAFLDLMWKSLRPAVETRDFFQRSERLRGEAYTRTHNYFSIPDLCASIRQVQFSAGAQHELTDIVELFHYNNPLLLLIAAVQLQAFEDGPASHRTGDIGAEHPVFAQKPIKITEESASAAIRKIYEDIKRTLGVNVVNTDYQAFARFPDFLNLYWAALKPAVLSPLYGENRHALRESAVSLASDLPNAPQLTVEHMLEAGLSSEEISAAIHITEEFLDLLSGLVLNIAFAKIALEGGNLSKASPAKDRISAQVKKELEADHPERAA